MTLSTDPLPVEVISRPTARRLLVLFATTFVIWCVLPLFLPHSRYIRFQQLAKTDLFRSRWAYERIHFDKTPIDVAIIGTSRVEAALSPVILEAELSKQLGHPVHVANLAIPDEGRNFHYLVVRELLETHPETKIILLSVSERADISHPAFRYLGDIRDILQAPFFINHYYFLDAAFLPYRQMSYFVQSIFPSWFGVSTALRGDYEGAKFDPTVSFYLPSGKYIDRYTVADPKKLLLQSQQLTNELRAVWRKQSSWEALNTPLEPEYSKRLATIAKKHCVEIIFVHLPYFDSPPDIYDKSFYQGLGPVLDATQFDHEPHNFADLAHFNRYGTLQLAPWLSTSMTPYLEPLKSPSCPANASR